MICLMPCWTRSGRPHEIHEGSAVFQNRRTAMAFGAVGALFSRQESERSRIGPEYDLGNSPSQSQRFGCLRLRHQENVTIAYVAASGKEMDSRIRVGKAEWRIRPQHKATADF